MKAALPSHYSICALDHVQDSVIVTDAQLEAPGPRIVYVNRSFTRITGYQRDEVMGKSPRLLQGPETDGRTLSQFWQSLERTGRFRGRAINYRKNGEAYLGEWSVRPLGNEVGLVTHYLAIQREVEGGVEGQRVANVVRAVLEASDVVACCALSPTHHFTMASEVFASAFGLDREELLGSHIRGLESQFLNPDVASSFFSAIEERATWRGELRVRGLAGRECVLALHVAPIFFAGQAHDTPSVVITGLDETLSRRYQGISDSVSLSNAISDAVGGLRQELGNPVNNIGAALTVLRRRWNSLGEKSINKRLNQMSTEVSRMKFLIGALRGYGEGETPRLEEIDLSAVVGEVVELLAATANEQECRLCVEVPPNTMVRADTRALVQVLMNLVDNSLDAVRGRPNGQVVVRAALRNAALQVEVADNGSGMDADTLERAVRPFFTTKPERTGLGLALSRSLLAQMGADLSISSRTEQGTKVRITFGSPR